MIDQIHTYGLERSIVDKFRVGTGLQDEATTSSMEYESRGENGDNERVNRIRSLKDRGKHRTSMRNRSESTSPPPRDKSRKPKKKANGSKVPADRFDSSEEC